MEFGVGSILEGKVTGITKFGAFVSLPGGRSGLVHISEIAYSYVNDVKDYLTEGQEVKVKVIGIDDNNRINLSIKKAMDPPPRPPRPAPGPAAGHPPGRRQGGPPRPGLRPRQARRYWGHPGPPRGREGEGARCVHRGKPGQGDV
ncbi:S1 RNA-binding domain-containing protein [Intestinimonas massiliensis (ex Afouda et al. 2020)]|uniref:S1 RNA-binding domain-containing protein n=1 Tax=Intestinimonas massiliensis (ex Afouda et al. 2020) TaxID=1673721 RepID=UPI000AC162C4